MPFDTVELLLLGYAKDRIYEDKHFTREYLNKNIRQVVAEILPHICQKVVENYFKWNEMWNNLRGGHLNEVELQGLS